MLTDISDYRMPTFFPGDQKAVFGSKAGKLSPESSKMTSKYPAAKASKNIKSPRTASSLRQYRQDDDLASQPETVYSQQSGSPKYAPDNANMRNLSQWHDNTGREGPSQYERRPEQREAQQYERFTSDPALSALPDVNIYEHILLLRKHGMSVKLDREAARIMPQPGRDEFNNHDNSIEHNPLTDRHNPSREEKQNVSHALEFVLRRGGKIDIPPFEPRPDIACLLMLKEHLEDEHKIYKHLSLDFGGLRN
ncbi:hypothetical protein G647_02191 [Cladophialophora carrionii CBS 160.54]|uniref:Uncharacterized protein n=1 Tax=Cladophialophora carrionii CBS 160.54 TaxID=1279043 RepID=V9DGI1_9EURO|nr:uncharacterized protein G647_02191 [Cladophialophora carrionii CBS 160.54]ETI25418.1 hypothetical protein G647_02191 [Cladophialophora carrionii CBS 160.54]